MEKRSVFKKSVLLTILVSVLFCVLIGLVGCTNINDLKKQGEQLVCAPEDAPEVKAAEKVPATAPPLSPITGKVTKEITEEPEAEANAKAESGKAEEKEAAKAETETEDIVTKTYTEGDLVKLTPKATDREQDKVTFKFSSPLNNNGEWQTKDGDAGTYFVTVTASDGRSEVSKRVKVIVVAKNKPPVVQISDNFKIKEGDTITLSPIVYDPEGKDVALTYSGWLSANTYTAGYDDSGAHQVTIVASDGELTTTKTVNIVVENVNRAPVLNNFKDITVREGEFVKIDAKAIDPDKEDRDKLVYTFSLPLNINGEWQTKVGDVGTYNIKVAASDGKAKDEEAFTLFVKIKNRAPIIKPIADMTGKNSITVEKGKTATITMNPEVIDEDGDKVTLTYSGWMSSNTKKITEADSGIHEVTITASDGKESTTTTVTIEINTPPEFEI